MPTLLSFTGIHLSFYSNDNKEPVHLHVEKGGAEGKIWLEPGIETAYFTGFTKAEEHVILK